MVSAALQRPMLVLAPNKTLAAQLYSEFREVFPENGYGIETVPVVIPPTDLTRRHLAAKQKELGHKNLVEDEAGGSP